MLWLERVSQASGDGHLVDAEAIDISATALLPIALFPLLGIATVGDVAASFAVLPPLLLVMAVTLMIIFLTELTSNTATTATMVPVLAALAPGLGVNTSLLIVPCTIAASCAFMMPVATPPNAIVFGSGIITIGQMRKAGFWLNIAGVTIITVIGYVIVLPMIRF